MKRNWAIFSAAILVGSGALVTAASGDPATIPQPTPAEFAAAGMGDLPVAPDSARIDIVAPTFSDPTNITNPLFPISDLHSAVLSGVVGGEPFHTETTLLPETRFIEWTDGQLVETRVSQYFAYIDGRIEEVALDYYAQADDGSVWYFGEDLFDYDEEGFSDSTEGAWLSGRDGPVAMIMPGDPEVGDVFRPENMPSIAFEEVVVSQVGTTVDGPTGSVDGALVATELHSDGSTSDKVFAPGYGEFFSGHTGDVEALALAVPTDALAGPTPDALLELTDGAVDVLDASHARRWRAAAAGIEGLNRAWATYQAEGVPTRLADEMDAALEALAHAVHARDRAAAGTAAIDVAQSSLDFRLRYEPQAEIDLARFAMWARQMIVDAGAHDLGGIRGDVTTLEWIQDRFAPAIDKIGRIRINVHLVELRNNVNDADRAAAAAEAAALLETLEGVEVDS